MSLDEADRKALARLTRELVREREHALAPDVNPSGDQPHNRDYAHHHDQAPQR